MRKLPSGRFQASYLGPDGKRHPAPDTFATERDAERWLVHAESTIARREWTNPDRAKVQLKDYAEAWIRERPKLRPRTVQLYEWLLGKYITPHLGTVQLGNLDTPMIRKWRADLLRDGVSESMAAKAYRLLRAVLMTAANEDRIIPRNPCQVAGAGTESPEERPVLTVAQVFDLAARMIDQRYRVFVLLAAFCTLRWGEITALKREDVAPDGSWLRVVGAFVELPGRGLVYGPPKSRAGKRRVTVPAAIRRDLVEHLDRFTDSAPDAWVFTGKRGNPLRRGTFNPMTGWKAAVKAIGVPHLHFHDLRHTGNTLAARTKVSTRDLMARMGHDSPRAALIYQHATNEADRELAAGLDGLIARERVPELPGETSSLWRDLTEEQREVVRQLAAAMPERWAVLLPDDDDGTAGALMPVG
ncbi:tyrosine-type recombinase/integrase [Saccharothrix longispora]|uniref:tyrosine-type recombinase/integrase n=1 Tax=Saccharothrix longispora TaxID=33920 RepID=UPI0028FDB0F2|nr:tyrosine-type recombinase/integrase [Saccharothrix longispora]MDU0289218.1 tyrosine-type recombinase/integrase [Saccharothrix longispora]